MPLRNLASNRLHGTTNFWLADKVVPHGVIGGVFLCSKHIQDLSCGMKQCQCYDGAIISVNLRVMIGKTL